jgi:NAD(P)H-nitrite reductase large subunit
MRIVIIGNGIAGMMAAMNLQQPNTQITLISKESPLFFSRPALMYVFMKKMKMEHILPLPATHWLHQYTIQAECISINIAEHTVQLSSGQVLEWDKLILATGSLPSMPDIPGIDHPDILQFYTLQDMAHLENKCRNAQSALIIGGGLTGAEVAEMLHAMNMDISMLIRGKYYWDNVLPNPEARLISGHLMDKGITLYFQETALSYTPGKGILTDKDRFINADMIIFCTGTKPQIALAKQSGIECRQGIITDMAFRTSVPDIYAIGDCAEMYNGHTYFTENGWYTGRAHGMALAEILNGIKSEYYPDLYYNSAKFFDTEYQVYGSISTQESPNSVLWHNEHYDSPRLIRLEYKQDDTLSGISTLGIRLREQICRDWIEQKITIHDAVQNFAQACFDPEFSAQYHTFLQKAAANQLIH